MSFVGYCDVCGCELISFLKELNPHTGHYEWITDGQGRYFCSWRCAGLPHGWWPGDN